MAYFLKNQNEDQNQQSGNQTQMSGGNIYSTSGSEVSSSTPTSTSSNSSSNSSQSNESGNWVNLNKYLDANQGKVGGYVDQLVKPYSDSATQFNQNMETAKQNQSQAIQNNTVSNDKITDIVKRYANNGSSITDDEYKTVSDAVQGNFKVNPFEQSDDYKQLNGTARDLGQVGKSLENKNYQESLMGNDVSSGGKNLNSFLIRGTQAGRDKISDYSTQFSKLNSLLDAQTQDLNNQRDTAIKQNQDTASSIIEAQKGQDIVGPKFIKENQQYYNSGAYKDYTPTKYNANGWLSRDGGNITFDLPTVYRATGPSDGVIKNEYNEYTDRLNSLLTGEGRQDSKLDDFYSYMSNSDWQQANNRANELKNYLTLTPSEVDQLPVVQRLVIEDLIWGLSSTASSPQLREKAREAYLGYLEGRYNTWSDLYKVLNAR